MMLTPQNVVKLMDFGIARSRSDPILTATGSTLGSLHYMSPEQVRGEQVDERSDLYSVGVSLYELVTGHRPFEAESDIAILTAQLQKPPAPSRVAAEVIGPVPPPTRRGLYITLGALIVVLVLAAAGLYLPHVKRAHAGAETHATVTQPTNPKPANPEPASAPSASPPVSAVGPNSHPPPAVVTPRDEAGALAAIEAGRSGKSLSGPSARKTVAKVASPEKKTGAAPNALSSPPPERRTEANTINQAAVGRGTDELPQVEHDLDLLAARADTVDASLNGMRQNQAAQGLSMRGDIAASQQRMRTYLDKAQSALKNQDSTTAKKYLNLAETELATLEKFLGR
jgi:serine/threonine-protein kinase